jgi:choline dehydrogenase-like flavoprotein
MSTTDEMAKRLSSSSNRVSEPPLSALEPQFMELFRIICSPGLIGPIPDPKNATKKHHLTLVASLMHPFSRGTVHHNPTIPNTTNPSPNTNSNPKINPRIISHPIDHTILTKGIECILHLTRTEPLKNAIKGYISPSELSTIDLDKVLKAVEQDKDDESRIRLEEILDSHIRNTVRTIQHPIGTAAMMSREDGGVVDEQLRVYGVDGLRVVRYPFNYRIHPLRLFVLVFRGRIIADIISKADLSILPFVRHFSSVAY